MKKTIAIILAVVSSIFVVAPITVLAQEPCEPSVEPDFYPNWNPGGGPAAECGQVACCNSEYHYKIEPWVEDTFIYVHHPDGNTITISNVDWDEDNEALTFNWDSEWPVSCVIVKANTGAYVYCYEAGSYGDTCLYAQGGAVSHATFCFNDNGGSSGGNGELPPEVGGTVFPVNKAALLAPWIALAVVTLAAITILVRRIRVQS